MWYTLSPSSFLSDVLSAVSVVFSSLAYCPAVQPVNAATVMDIASNNAITFFMFVSSNVFFFTSTRQSTKRVYYTIFSRIYQDSLAMPPAPRFCQSAHCSAPARLHCAPSVQKPSHCPLRSRTFSLWSPQYRADSGSSAF